MTTLRRTLQDDLRLSRLYLLILAIFTLGRWLQGLLGVPYERGHHVFSLVIMTAISCLYYGAFTRRWRGYGLMDAVVIGVLLGLMGQTVILLSTIVSYGFGLDTYFNNPVALNSPQPLAIAQALSVRIGGLVGNSILAGVLGALGWTIGGLLPEN
jgi:hypothetical protein